MSNKTYEDIKLFVLRFIVSLSVIFGLLHGITPAEELQAHEQIDTQKQTCKVYPNIQQPKTFELPLEIEASSSLINFNNEGNFEIFSNF